MQESQLMRQNKLEAQQKEFTETQEAARIEREKAFNKPPFTIMGYGEHGKKQGLYIIRSNIENRIIYFKAAQLGSLKHLFQIAPLSYWKITFPSLDRDAIANHLISCCQKKGFVTAAALEK